MAKAKRPTYAKAKAILLDALSKAQGWTVTTRSRGSQLKTPYAEHSWGRQECRLWFKTQSIYFVRGGGPFSLNNASSAHTDPRMLAEVVESGKMTPDELGAFLVRTICDPPESNPERIPGGLAQGMSPSQFDQEQLRRGALVELEHTGDRRMAREIAMDHLAEHPGYYVALEKMERELESNPKRRRTRGVKRKERDVLEWYRSNRGSFTRDDLRHQVGLSIGEADAVYRFLVNAERTAKSYPLDGDADQYGIHYWDETGPMPNMTGLADALRGGPKATAEDNPALPLLEPLDLAGQRVALAINLHRCRPGKSIPKGAACFSVRAKPRSSSKVLGYADRLVLKDVEFVVNERSLDRIQGRGTREVCCFVVGTVVRPRAPELKGACACDWTPIKFNPFRAPCFTTPEGKCAVSARYAAMVGKSVAAEGVRSA